MILGWLGAIESILVIILTTIGLTHIPQIMDHLRNETMSVKLQNINETHVSIFRKQRGEMSADDEMFIERGLFDILVLKRIIIYFYFLTGMYVILTLNLIVNIVTLISSLLLITGSIKVRCANTFDIRIMQLHSIDHDCEKCTFRFYFTA